MFKPKAARLEALEAAVRSAIGHAEWIETVRVSEQGRATIILRADPDDLAASEARRMEAESAARSVKGIAEAHAALTAEREPAPATGTRRVRKGARLSEDAISQATPEKRDGIAPIPNIKRIIAVTSAKGGVGKSTVAVNLAAALAKIGLNVGLLDADIYGPSLPTMLGTVEADPRTGAHGKLEPVEAHGMKSLSIGYLTDPDAPMIWRGPMVMSAITQMLQDAQWSNGETPLDLLIMDTPPGTGDAALTLAQRVPLTAALIVTTPQEIALADVRRGAAMFAKTAVPVLGIVETMSWFEDPMGQRHALFGEGGGSKMAASLGLPLLAELPFFTEIRAGGDAGIPAALGEGPAGPLFASLAASVIAALDDLDVKSAPKIIFED
ncbi:MAG: Mrp/NBP35 family ATP-binding protein [Pseudomonadota bacterium]